MVLCGFWSIHARHELEPHTIYMFLHLFTILNDAICIGNFAHDMDITNGKSPEKFSLAMGIINLILKPFTALIAYQEYSTRGSQMGSVSHQPSIAPQYEAYPRPASGSIVIGSYGPPTTVNVSSTHSSGYNPIGDAHNPLVQHDQLATNM